MEKALLAAVVAVTAAQVSAQVYRCEVGGKTVYSDAPCLAAKRVDVTPTRGADSWTGKQQKGTHAIREDMNHAFDDALKPLTGLSRDQMDAERRRYRNGVTPADKAECQRLESATAALEKREQRTEGAQREQTQLELFKARQRYHGLKC